ncbi:MAG: WecB/TagA/CpsF family glycosyltransferase [Sphingomonas bacterium]|uniref:WecB/TagA/CpsF family glycosyltransferase n=1 Tax=Sphingomonas bacterium TaxID=1895847 RepID=UPI00262A85D7|nr:WecB/TagA/CpsF family glycosyltransferase [Sphingomonas bacterium]MDB5710392.1 WecB/TagA/CpsF family glycosyltransferase [Sphingomonas bacterium]
MTSTDILGTPIAITDLAGATAHLLQRVAAREGGYICLRDAHGIMLARRDPDLRAIHRDAAMNLPDGMPLVHVARWRGHRAIGRVAGTDLVEALVDAGRGTALRHYFYVGKPGVAERMAATLARRFPGLVVAGCASPPFGEVDDATMAEALAAIVAARADMVWVGLSTPKQERWMHRHHRALPGMTLIGVGAAFDFVTGEVGRAPRWMQCATLEWLHRLLSEPGRLWRRYLLLAPRFAWLILTEGAK